MGYLDLNGAWETFVSANFIDCLQGMGVSTDYIDGFDTTTGGTLLFGCGGAPFNRMWLSSYLFPFDSSVIVSPGANVQCGGSYAYGIVGVAPTAGSGWYFYASNGVDECDLTNFISYCLVSVEPFDCSGGSGNGVQPNCPAEYTWNGSKCLPNSGGSSSPIGGTCPAGTTWNGSQCVSSGNGSGSGSGSGSAAASSVNWMLIGGGIAAALGLVGLMLMMEG
jgi:hypothetical protein